MHGTTRKLLEPSLVGPRPSSILSNFIIDPANADWPASPTHCTTVADAHILGTSPPHPISCRRPLCTRVGSLFPSWCRVLCECESNTPNTLVHRRQKSCPTFKSIDYCHYCTSPSPALVSMTASPPCMLVSVAATHPRSDAAVMSEMSVCVFVHLALRPNALLSFC